ncbi:MAG: hypothetical protein HDS59_01305 [Barnesiella sp.]|nr:hypothetical protein [Barnesiella sp.]
MTYFKHIIFLILSITLWDNGSSALAQNIIERTAKYAPEMPDTFFVKFSGLSNDSQVDFEIRLDISSKGKPFEVYSAEGIFCDSLFKPIEPFNMNVPIEDLSSDSLISWHCIIRFPYRQLFKDSDVCSLNTSLGKFSGSTYFRTPYLKKETPPSPHQKYIIVILSIITGFSILGLILLYKNARRKKSEEIIHLGQQLECSNSNNAELDKKIKELYSGRWEVFNRLCDEYFNKKDAETDSVRISVHKELERQITELRSTKSLVELEELVNTYNNGIITRIRTQMPKLSNKDVAFLTYLYAGFSPKAICLFTDSKIKNFYNRRTRLRDKILESDAPDREELSSKMQLNG